MGDGLCPAFGPDTVIEPTDDNPDADTPNLIIVGGPSDGAFKTATAWNQLLTDTYGVAPDCAWGAPANATIDDLEGARLVSIAYDTVSGTFTSEFAIDGLAAGTNPHDVVYSVRQNESYRADGGAQGATTSGDTLTNAVDIYALTTPIADLAGVESATGAEASSGDWNASDDSGAELHAALTKLSKHVLARSAGTFAREFIARPEAEGGPNPSLWRTEAPEPFALGDEVWYRLVVTPPAGADVRNPKLTDFLPKGVTFDPTMNDDIGRPENVVVWPAGDRATLPWIGECEPDPDIDDDDEQALDWLATFVPSGGIELKGNVLTFELGTDDCFAGSTDRFMPLQAPLAIYIKVTVTDVSAFGTVDMPENLAKYQQENVEGDIFFLREAASIELAESVQLTKGIREIDGVEFGDGDDFNSAETNAKVVHGNKVTYRIDVTNPIVDTRDFVIWDALPPGIKRADVKGADTGTGDIDPPYATAAAVEDGTESPIAPAKWAATVYDHGSYPPDVASHLRADVKLSERSIIVWTVNDVTPASTADEEQGLTLGYTVVVPDGTAAGGGAAALLDQHYINDASIVSYAPAAQDGSALTTIVPVGSGALSTQGPTTGQAEVSDDSTFDDAEIFLPSPDVTKTRISTEIPSTTPSVTDTNNPADVIVQGELATYDFSVVLPANTTVREGVLFDLGSLVRQSGGTMTPGTATYRVESASLWEAPDDITVVDTAGADPVADDTDFGFRTDTGKLVFPEYYTVGPDDETFTVRLTLWVQAVDASNTTSSASRPAIGNDAVLRNTAAFDSKAFDGTDNPTQSDFEDVTYRDPAPSLDKTVVGTMGADGVVTFKLTASNASGRPSLYDVRVIDCVPAEFTVATLEDPDQGSIQDAGDCSIDDDGAIIGGTGTGTLLVWTFDRLDAGPAVSYEFDAKLVNTAGSGASYTNYAELTGYTLPSTLLNDPEDRRGDRVATADAEVDVALATLDKSVTPTSAPVGDTVRYTLEVTLPPYANFYNVTLEDELPAGVVFAGNQDVTFGGGWAEDSEPALSTPADGAGSLSWTIDPDHIEFATTERTITVEFDATITDGIGTAASVTNDALFGWNVVEDDDDSHLDDPADATVTILDPELTIAKTVSDTTPDPGEEFDYELIVTNVGDTPAHHIVITDDVPEGIVVDTTTIAPATGAGWDVDWTSGVATGDGGTITWKFDGPLTDVAADGNALTLGYTATLIASAEIADDDTFKNTASVDHYESFPTGGREYDPTDVEDEATVAPAFPDVTPTKAVTDGSVAVVGEPFSWTLTATNHGDGPAQTVTMLDTLPANWTFDAVQSVSINGLEMDTPPTPTFSGTGAPGSEQTIQWVFGRAASSATPSPQPILQPGISIVIEFTAVPGAGALTNAGVTQAGPPVVHVPHTNTLAITEATDTSDEPANEDGPYGHEDDEADAFIHSADLVLTKTAGTTVTAGGPAATGWTIAVRNDGPDTAVGPFEIVDTFDTLPDSIAVTGATGPGWTCMLDDPLDPTGFDCERTDAADTLASGASFPEITVTVQVAADFDPTAPPVGNTARVTGGTYDPDPSNNDDDDLPVTTEADLAIVKTLTTAAPNAGEAIGWSLEVTNHGPSDSRSVTGDLITVTDEIPDGVSGVTITSTLPTGWSETSTGPYDAGDTITLVLDAGTSMPASGAGSTVSFTLSGTIDTDHPQATALVNTGVVKEGPTTDPDPGNNEDSESTTPGTTTVLTIDKHRVVETSPGTWVPAAGLDPVPDVVPGDPVTYLIEVGNAGPAVARTVTITDAVPAYLTYSGFVGVSGGTWARTSTGTGPGDGQVFVLDEDLAVGASASIRLTLTIDPAHTAAVRNTATASSEDSNDPTDHDDSDVNREVDLGVVKSHSGTGIAGETLDYTLLVTNHGPSDSDGPIVVTDTLPVGMSYDSTVSVSVVGTAETTPTAPVITGVGTTASPYVLTWTFDDAGLVLEPGDEIELVVRVAIDESQPAATLVNRATVNGPHDDPVPSNNSDPDETQVVTEADMTITKSVNGTTWYAGGLVTYELAIENTGPSYARNVSVVEDPDPRLTIEAMSGTDWDCDLVTLSCERDEHPIGSSTIQVTARIGTDVPESTSLPNAVQLSWTDERPGPHTDDDDEPIEVSIDADLGIVKDVITEASGTAVSEPAPATAGQKAWYRLQVTNSGPSDAAGPLTVADVLPVGVTVPSSLTSVGPWTVVPGPVVPGTPQTVTFTLADGQRASTLADPERGLAPVIEFEVDLDPAIADGTSLVNEATVSSPTPDSEPGNDSDTATIQAERWADVGVVKSHPVDANGQVVIDQPLDFTILVTNHGPSDASDITIYEAVPEGLEITSTVGPVGPSGWTIDSINLYDPADPLGGGVIVASYAQDLGTHPTTMAAAPLVISTVPRERAVGTVPNHVEVTAEESDPDLSNNEFDDPLDVLPRVTLIVTKTATSAFKVGKAGTYEITVENLGPHDDPGPITVEDVLPAGLTFKGSPDSGVEVVDQTVTWEVPGLEVGETVTLHLVVDVHEAAYPSVTNLASATTPSELTPDSEPDDAETVTVAEADPLPATGASVPIVLAGSGLLLVLLGIVIFAASRRRGTIIG